jgi:oxygen-independent coproporphyrinogen-3 oxidase
MSSQPIILDPYQYRNQSIASDNPLLAIYAHIPFCTSMCTYCAFNTYARLEHLIPDFVKALKRELTFASEGNLYPEVGTIFFGGGTPSLLSPAQFKELMVHIGEKYQLVANAEITSELNPNDLHYEYLAGLRESGINRLSIGMQSSNHQELKFFARRHDHQGVVKAVQEAQRAGFDNINLDLIYGVPYQTLESWKQSLDDALALNIQHLSLYALGLEEGTPLNNWVNNGDVPAPDDDLAADMYEYASEKLAEHGFIQYEISNWALPDKQCRHNLQYWRNLPYIGVGPGAHGFANGIRYAVIRSPQRYIKSLLEATEDQERFPHTPAVEDFNPLSLEDEISETLIMALRLLNEGVGFKDFEKRFGVDLRVLHHDTLTKYAGYGLLMVNEDRIKLTKAGRLLCNMIFRELVE